MKRRRRELGFARTAHGNAANRAVPVMADGTVSKVTLDGEPRLEVPPVDELPAGRAATRADAERAEVAARPEPRAVEISRAEGGQVRDSAGARRLAELSAQARRAKAERMALLPSLLRDLKVQGVPAGAFDLEAIDEFVEAEASRLAREFGAGECPDATRAVLQTSALQLQASRLAFARGDHAEASRLGNDSRQNLLAAHAIAAKSGEARGVEQAPKVADGEIEKTESTDPKTGAKVVVEKRVYGKDESTGEPLVWERRTTTDPITGEERVWSSAIATFFRGIERGPIVPDRVRALEMYPPAPVVVDEEPDVEGMKDALDTTTDAVPAPTGRRKRSEALLDPEKTRRDLLKKIEEDASCRVEPDIAARLAHEMNGQRK